MDTERDVYLIDLGDAVAETRVFPGPETDGDPILPGDVPF